MNLINISLSISCPCTKIAPEIAIFTPSFSCFDISIAVLSGLIIIIFSRLKYVPMH